MPRFTRRIDAADRIAWNNAMATYNPSDKDIADIAYFMGLSQATIRTWFSTATGGRCILAAHEGRALCEWVQDDPAPLPYRAVLGETLAPGGVTRDTMYTGKLYTKAEKFGDVPSALIWLRSMARGDLDATSGFRLSKAWVQVTLRPFTDDLWAVYMAYRGMESRRDYWHGSDPAEECPEVA